MVRGKRHMFLKFISKMLRKQKKTEVKSWSKKIPFHHITHTRAGVEKKENEKKIVFVICLEDIQHS